MCKFLYGGFWFFSPLWRDSLIMDIKSRTRQYRRIITYVLCSTVLLIIILVSAIMITITQTHARAEKHSNLAIAWFLFGLCCFIYFVTLFILFIFPFYKRPQKEPHSNEKEKAVFIGNPIYEEGAAVDIWNGLNTPLEDKTKWRNSLGISEDI